MSLELILFKPVNLYRSISGFVCLRNLSREQEVKKEKRAIDTGAGDSNN
jgi:hypothetical protein